MSAPNRPSRLLIGTVLVAPAIVLAPMEGLTDLPFRRLVRRIGGLGLTVTEFVASEGLVRDVPRMLEMAALDPDEHPASVQIYGRRSASMAEAARRVVDLGADIVDINMGCPSRKVCAHSGGAALLRDPALVRDIVRAVRGAVTVPVTVKIRTGTTRDQRNGPEIARICEGEGADALTVHWRTREEGFKGLMDPAPVADVRAAVSIPVIGNGDVVDPASAARMLDGSGCHGLMVGRGAIRDPWLPLRLSRWLAGLPAPEITIGDRHSLFREYVDAIRVVFRTDRGALGRVKKFAGYFTHGLPGGSALRRDVLHATTLEEALDRFTTWAESAEPEAAPPVPAEV